MGWKVLAFSKTAFPPKNCHITSGAGGDTFYDPAFSSCKCLFLRPHTVLYFSSQVWVKPCFGNVTISTEVGTRFFSWHAITIHIHCVIFLEPLFPIADFFSPPPPLRSEPLIHPLPIAVEPCGESFTFLWWWWPTPIYTVPIPTLGWRKIAKNFRTSFAPQYCASNSATRYTVSALKSASASCQKGYT